VDRSERQKRGKQNQNLRRLSKLVEGRHFPAGEEEKGGRDGRDVSTRASKATRKKGKKEPKKFAKSPVAAHVERGKQIFQQLNLQKKGEGRKAHCTYEIFGEKELTSPRVPSITLKGRRRAWITFSI